ncbi:MAG: hypothetical protein ACYDBB_06000 [Armatimonadota bacterium]
MTTALMLASCVLFADTPTYLTGAEDAIARANALGNEGKYQAAIDNLQVTLERYPTYAPVYLYLSHWQQAKAADGLLRYKDAQGRSFDTEIETVSAVVKMEEVLGILRRHLSDLNTADNPVVRDRNLTVKTAYAIGDLFNTYGQASMYLEDDSEIRRRVSALTSEDFPLLLGEYGPLALPGDLTPVTFALSDPQLPVSKRRTEQGLITSKPLPVLTRYRRDPKYGMDSRSNDPRFRNWSFQYMLLAYEYQTPTKEDIAAAVTRRERAITRGDAHDTLPDIPQPGWRLRFRVMWQDVPAAREARAQLAQNVAQLLLRSHWLLRAYTGLTPLFAQNGVINVWLAEKGEAGGEASNDNIYLQEIGVPRPNTEWVREVLHEYGHQTLPVVGGYSKPEWAANGRLGERLYLRWLLRNPEAKTAAHPWLANLDLAQQREVRLDRLIRLFANEGPEVLKTRKMDETAMDEFVGMALYYEQTRVIDPVRADGQINGSNLLAMALKEMKTPTFSDPQHDGFVDTLEANERTNQYLYQRVTLRLSEVPKDIPLWVFLDSGTWQGQFSCWNDAALKGKLIIDGVEVKLDEKGAFSTGRFNTKGAFVPGEIGLGWHTIRLISEPGTNPELVSLKLIRQSKPTEKN